MLVLGTKPEYFNAVWVKNEWSRFLKIMKNDRTKLMIPCYKDMDPYELPEEFAHLQAQNMSKIGFINDLVRGINKIVAKETVELAIDCIAYLDVVNALTKLLFALGVQLISALLKRGYMSLEDGDWEKADAFFEDVLNQDAECATAYWGKYLAANRQASSDILCKILTDQYQNAKYEKKEAFPENTLYIENAVNNFSKIGIYSEEKIRNYYKNFDRSYESETDSRKSQKQELLQTLDSDKLFSRARQYAKGDVKELIDHFLGSINTIMVNRIQQAIDNDASKVNEKLSAYQQFLSNTDSKIYNELQALWIPSWH